MKSKALKTLQPKGRAGIDNQRANLNKIHSREIGHTLENSSIKFDEWHLEGFKKYLLNE